MQKSGFITKSACRGFRPNSISSLGSRQRPNLIARLAKERGIARFVVAPAGYGKTTLLADYAETMFSWTHVFWFNAQSPCFIRDLDAGGFAQECFARDEAARLVVVDDLPQLDDQRARAFSSEIDEFLDRGCEVVVLCTPSSDLLGSLQRDRMRLGAADLLLDDDEIDAVRTEDERVRRPAAQLPAACRVPALVWGGDNAGALFVSASLSEDLPADFLLVSACAFVLNKGTVDDLVAFSSVDRQTLADLFKDYPHFGFDFEAERFEAPRISIDNVAPVLKGRLESIMVRSPYSKKSDLALAWSDALVARGDAGRACDVMRLLSPAKERINWLVDHARALVYRGCFHAPTRIIRSVKGAKFDHRMQVAALDALCRRMLGDAEGSVRRAKRCAFEQSVPDDVRAIGLLIVERNGLPNLSAKATEALAAWARLLADRDASSLSWEEQLVAAWKARRDGLDELERTWSVLHANGGDDIVLGVTASWLFRMCGEEWGSGAAPDSFLRAEAERYIRQRLADDEAMAGDFPAISAGLSMERAHASGMKYADGPLESSVLLELRRAEVSMLMQTQRFERDQRDEQAGKLGPSAYRQAPGASASQARGVQQRSVPPLELRLFGRFDVFIGGVPIDQKRMSRKHARVLLVLLAVARGRDLSRETIVETMWPMSDPDKARKNFYSVWSQLQRALTLPDGTCPYLVRHPFGCHLEDHYVRSDVARLDEICRELLFGKPDFENWLDLYTEIDRDFSCDLLPAEEGNPLIAKARADCRNRLIDSLLAATMRLAESGNPQWGILFARAALDRDHTREDAYVALMRAQIANDQRTAAMMTYLNCRSVLSEELGIDPSPETTALYDSLLGES